MRGFKILGHCSGSVFTRRPKLHEGRKILLETNCKGDKKMISSIPTEDDIHALFTGEKVARDFLISNGAVNVTSCCSLCNGQVSLHGAEIDRARGAGLL